MVSMHTGSRSTSACMIILTTNYQYTESRFMLSPSGVVWVCPGADLVTTCSTDRNFINWSVTVENRSGQALTRDRLVSFMATSVEPLRVGMRIFNMSVTSTTDSFTSVLSFTNVTTDLNNTEINCSDIGSSVSESRSSVALVHVIAVDLG